VAVPTAVTRDALLQTLALDPQIKQVMASVPQRFDRFVDEFLEWDANDLGDGGDGDGRENPPPRPNPGPAPVTVVPGKEGDVSSAGTRFFLGKNPADTGRRQTYKRFFLRKNPIRPLFSVKACFFLRKTGRSGAAGGQKTALSGWISGATGGRSGAAGAAGRIFP